MDENEFRNTVLTGVKDLKGSIESVKGLSDKNGEEVASLRTELNETVKTLTE